MVSTVSVIVRRVEAGLALQAMIKGGDVRTQEGVKTFSGGYTKGSWKHIDQSDKVIIKAWKPTATRARS